jgi:hypothetical protein
MTNPAISPSSKTSNLKVVHKSTKRSQQPFNIPTIAILVLLAIILLIINTVIDDSSKTSSMPESDINWDNPPCSPDDLSNDWKEVTPEMMQKNSQRREFQYKDTNFKIAFDEGILGQPQYRGKNHWHIYNPNGTGAKDYYLDKNGNPIHKNDKNSHIDATCK